MARRGRGPGHEGRGGGKGEGRGKIRNKRPIGWLIGTLVHIFLALPGPCFNGWFCNHI